MAHRLPGGEEPLRAEAQDGAINVLHVDDNPDFLGLVETYLERESDRIKVATTTDPEQALDHLADHDVDCVVSDYDMPGTDGLTLLKQIRDRNEAVPFVLFTGKGSEEIASQAISAGVTDYIQKGSGAERYALLANRIENAVDSARTKTAAERGRQRLRSLAEAFSDLVFFIDEDGRYLDVLAGPETSLLYDDAEALVGKQLHDVFPEETADRFLETVERTIETGEIQTVEYDLEVECGRRWFEARTGPLDSPPDDGRAIVWVARDITKRRTHEETIAYERDRLEAIFQTVPEPLVHIDFQDDEPVVLRVNDAFQEVFGHAEPDVVGASLNDLIVPDRLMDEATDLDQRSRDAGGIEREVRREAADGERIFRFRAAPVVQRDEQVEWVGTYVDVTEQPRRGEELERQRDRLQEFAGFVSHDLQSPLSVASGALDVARQDCDTAYLDDVAAAHERMGTLLDDVVQLVRDGERVTELERVALDDLATDAWTNVETQRADLAVETDATLLADPVRLQRILENLFRNAVQHGPGAEGDAVDLTVTVTRLPDEPGFAVADDGTGIPPDHRGDVFDTGYSTKPAGTGFGLAIVGEIAAAHGWTVSATESDEGGARIEFRDVTFADED